MVLKCIWIRAYIHFVKMYLDTDTDTFECI